MGTGHSHFGSDLQINLRLKDKHMDEDDKILSEYGIIPGDTLSLSITPERETCYAELHAPAEGAEVGFANTALGGVSMPVSGPTGVWSCKQCTFDNPMQNTQCEMCLGPR